MHLDTYDRLKDIVYKLHEQYLQKATDLPIDIDYINEFTKYISICNVLMEVLSLMQKEFWENF